MMRGGDRGREIVRSESHVRCHMTELAGKIATNVKLMRTERVTQ